MCSSIWKNMNNIIMREVEYIKEANKIEIKKSEIKI